MESSQSPGTKEQVVNIVSRREGTVASMCVLCPHMYTCPYLPNETMFGVRMLKVGNRGSSVQVDQRMWRMSRTMGTKAQRV